MVNLLKKSVVSENENKNREKEELLRRHLPHVRKIARHYALHLPAEEKDEVFSAAALGLVEAYTRYSHEMKTSFWTYAQNRVIGAIQDDLRKKDPLTRSQRKKVKQVNRAYLKHTQVFGEQPKEDDISRLSGMSIDEIRKARFLSHAVQFISFEEYESRDDGSKAARISDENAIHPEEAAISLEQKSMVHRMVTDLPERERTVIELLYYGGKTPKQISAMLGVTEGRISQINKQAITRLRKKAKYM